jgi:hypothetical protein
MEAPHHVWPGDRHLNRDQGAVGMPHEVKRRVAQLVDSLQDLPSLARDREGFVWARMHAGAWPINDNGPIAPPDEVAREAPGILAVTEITVDQDNRRSVTSTLRLHYL